MSIERLAVHLAAKLRVAPVSTERDRIAV